MSTGPSFWRGTESGAEIAVAGSVVVKRHRPGTPLRPLIERLALAADHPAFVPPLRSTPLTDADGRPVTLWPRVPVLDPNDAEHPWVEAARLLARLHLSPAPAGLPRHGWAQRLARVRNRAPTELVPLADRLLAQLAARAEPARLVHGDWHLGQLGHWTDGWRLIDIDDVGLGDPAWDLARPAGFWAAGLLPDDDWDAFLDAYRAAGGPAVPRHGDPWPVLDLPARCAVLVAAMHSGGTADALVEACRRMAQ